MTSAPTSSLEPLDQYDNALIQYLKRTHKPTFNGVIAIYSWRVAMDPSYVLRSLSAVASHLWELCEQYDLLGASFSSSPVAFGGLGVMVDAAPGREWALLLQENHTDPLASPDRLYWWRIISVLCSRLMMTNVSKLPGYNGDATEGPMWDVCD